MATNRDDVLVGTDGDDVLNGRRGDDVLIGGLGSDTLTGGSGADVFQFNFEGDGLPWHARTYDGVDTITDFSAAEGDTLSFSGEIGDLRYVGVTSTADGDALITHFGQPLVVLDGVSAADFSLDWIVF